MDALGMGEDLDRLLLVLTKAEAAMQHALDYLDDQVPEDEEASEELYFELVQTLSELQDALSAIETSTE